MPTGHPDPPPPAAPERLRRLPSWLVNHLAGRANRLMTARLGRLSLRTDYAVLASLHESGPASQAELGRRLAIDRSDMVAVLNRLEAQGHAVRRSDERDRRRNAITITATGRRLLAELEAQVELAQHDLLAPLSPEQRRELLALLQQLHDHHHCPPP